MLIRVALIALVSVLAAGDECWCATILLERDGTGDYSVLQDAINAAAVGDTILVGPGRYDDIQVVALATGTEVATIARIEVDSLTILGDPAGESVIGPRDHINYYENTLPTAWIAVDSLHPIVLRLEQLVLENGGGLARMSGPTIVERCVFRVRSNWGAIVFDYGSGASDRVVFRYCTFESPRPGTGPDAAFDLAPYRNGPGNLLLEQCTFTETTMNLRDIKSIAVRDVSVVEGRVLFRVVNGRIDRLRVSNEVGVALTTSSSDLVFSDCWFRGGAGGNTAIFGRHSTVEVYSTVFAAPTEATEFGATVVLELAKSAQFRGCEFQVVEPWTVLVRTPADWVWTSGSGLDLRQNYWGTTDSLEIERLVYDAGDEDHPEYPSPGDHPSMIGYSELERVQFWPVLDNLVRSSSRSIGGLKSRFRERR